jgi:hypothetical protein
MLSHIRLLSETLRSGKFENHIMCYDFYRICFRNSDNPADSRLLYGLRNETS